MQESIWISRAGSVWGKCVVTNWFVQAFSSELQKQLKRAFSELLSISSATIIDLLRLLSPHASRLWWEILQEFNYPEEVKTWNTEKCVNWWCRRELLVFWNYLCQPAGWAVQADLSAGAIRRGGPSTCSINPCVGSQAAPFHISSYFWQLKLLPKFHPRIWEVQSFTFINRLWKPSAQCLENYIFYCDPLSSSWQRHFPINTFGLWVVLLSLLCYFPQTHHFPFLARKILLLSLSSFDIHFARAGEKGGLLICTISCWILIKLHYLLFYLSWNLWGLRRILGISLHAWEREAHL